MSEPKNKPEREEPSIGNSDGIKPTQPAANSNDSKVDPVVGVTPEIPAERADGKKEPVVTLPLPEAPKGEKVEPVVPPVSAPVVLQPASEPAAAPVNDNTTAPVAAPAAAVDKPADAKPADAAPVAAAADVPPPANPPAPPADAPAAKPSRMRGFLKGAFNFAASAATGFAASFAIKATVGTALVAASVPAWATIGLTSALIGVSAALIADAKNRHARKKEGQELTKYFSRAHGKELLSKRSLVTFGISTAGAVLGSVVAAGFQDGTIQNAWNNFWGNNPQPVPPVIVPPAETIVPPPVENVLPPTLEPVPPTVAEVPPPVVVAPVCLTPAEQFSQLIDGHNVSDRVADAMTRAASTNPAVAAQGTKDLAFFAFNGFDGVPKDANVAVELFKQAAEGGNAQAKVDLVYMQYHGLGGIEADPKAAVATMKSLPGARAAHFVQAWGGAGKSVAKAAFSTDAIFKGMAVGCPKL